MRDISKEHSRTGRISTAVENYKQRVYLRLISGEAENVYVGSSEVNVPWLKNGQEDKISEIAFPVSKHHTTLDQIIPLLKQGKMERVLVCKIAAACLCNTFWKMRLCYLCLWRWFYYCKRYDFESLRGLLETAYWQSRLPDVLIPDGDSVDVSRLSNKEWLFAEKRWLLGLIKCKEYEYRWGHTKAQLEAISLNKTLVIFKK